MAHEGCEFVKLTENDIIEIRKEPLKGPGGRGGTGSGLTLRQIAKKYNTTYRNIRAILDRETWRIT